MEPEEYQRMFEMEDHHWWFQAREDLVRRILRRHGPPCTDTPPRLLDIGCGTGMFLEHQGGRFLGVGLDFSSRALGFTRKRGIKRLVCADSESLPFATGSFDIVTAFDLIEHVEGDRRLIDEANRVLKPGGILLATVPAHPYLWSAHDIALHHKRRYRREEFGALFDPDRWACRRLTYMFTSIYPIAALIRSMRKLLPSRGSARSDTRRTPQGLNQLLIGWHKLEAAWLERYNLPMGLSILTVQRKRSLA